MEIATEYNIGDQIYTITTEVTLPDCTVCSGTRTLTGNDGIKITCPVCSGTGSYMGPIHKDLIKYHIMGPTKIEKIDISCIDPNNKNYNTTYYRFSLMLDTYIPLGLPMFKTEKAANEEVKKLETEG